MKTVVLSEGKHDVHLISNILDIYRNKVTRDWFIAEELDGDDQILPAESEAFRQFLWEGGRGDFLLKSEEGLGNLIKVFSNICADLINRTAQGDDVNCLIVVDLDGGEIEGLRERFNDKMDGFYGGNVRLASPTERVETPDFLTWEAEIEVSGDVHDEFMLLTFKQNFESAAGFEHDALWEHKETAIRRYAEQEYVHPPIIDLIFD